jgi:hypothetical protein
LRDRLRPEPAAPGAVARVAALEVVLGEDERPLQGRSSIGPGLLSWIPLVPYGHQRISPETGALATSIETETFLGDVADAVVADLQAARVAERVGREEKPLEDLGGEPTRAADPAYRLKLTLDEGIYHRYLTLYGISIPGAFLWMVGLPVSYGHADLAFTVELLDPAGAFLGRRSFDAKEGATEWLYWPFTASYTRAMPRAYEDISPDLRQFVAESLTARAADTQATAP